MNHPALVPEPALCCHSPFSDALTLVVLLDTGTSAAGLGDEKNLTQGKCFAEGRGWSTSILRSGSRELSCSAGGMIWKPGIDGTLSFQGKQSTERVVCRFPSVSLEYLLGKCSVLQRCLEVPLGYAGREKVLA